MMPFPLDTLLDEQACYDFLLHVLHPDGLACPHGHQLPPNPTWALIAGISWNADMTSTLCWPAGFPPAALYLMLLPRPMNSTKMLARKTATTMTLPTHPVAVPRKPVVMALGRLIGHRLRVWLAAAALRSACRSAITAIVRHFSLSWKGIPAMMRQSPLMNGRPRATSQRRADAIRPSAMALDSANGRVMMTALASAKSTPTRSKASGRAYETSCAPSVA